MIANHKIGSLNIKDLNLIMLALLLHTKKKEIFFENIKLCKQVANRLIQKKKNKITIHLRITLTDYRPK